MTKRIYLDNAATTWPKPIGVSEAMQAFLADNAANPGRGGHRQAIEAGRAVFSARYKLAQFLGVQDASRLVFTASATQALNMALFGVLKTGDHCVTTSLEHNAVARPLHYLASHGVEYTAVPGEKDGSIDPLMLKKALRKNTRLMVITHASNVCGTIVPVQAVGEVARQAGVPLLVDAAQTAGVLPIDVEAMGIDMLAVPGHKSLLGPTGIGLLYVKKGLQIDPLVYGGTGSFSAELNMPEIFPDRLEAGTLNTIGIVGLSAALDYITERGRDSIYKHELYLSEKLRSGLASIFKVQTYGQKAGAPIVAFNVGQMGSTEVAHILDADFGIAVRAGLHCAPGAHQTLGTLEQGVVRASPGPFSTVEEIDKLLAAIEEIAKVERC